MMTTKLKAPTGIGVGDYRPRRLRSMVGIPVGDRRLGETKTELGSKHDLIPQVGTKMTNSSRVIRASCDHW